MIRITLDAQAQTRVDLHSTSRSRRLGDFGSNTRLIGAFVAALDRKVTRSRTPPAPVREESFPADAGGDAEPPADDSASVEVAGSVVESDGDGPGISRPGSREPRRHGRGRGPRSRHAHARQARPRSEPSCQLPRKGRIGPQAARRRSHRARRRAPRRRRQPGIPPAADGDADPAPGFDAPEVGASAASRVGGGRSASSDGDLGIHVFFTLRARDDGGAARIAVDVDRRTRHVQRAVDREHGPDDQGGIRVPRRARWPRAR